jgi:hypothetical protein
MVRGVSNPRPSQRARRVVVLSHVRPTMSLHGTSRLVERVIVSALGLSRLALLPIGALARTLVELTTTAGRSGRAGIRRPAAFPAPGFRRDPAPRPVSGHPGARPRCRQASRS